MRIPEVMAAPAMLKAPRQSELQHSCRPGAAAGPSAHPEFAFVQPCRTLDHALDCVPLDACDQVPPAPFQILILPCVQQHFEVIDVQWVALQTEKCKSA